MLHKSERLSTRTFGRVSYLQNLFNLLQWSQEDIRSPKNERKENNEASQKCEKMENKKETGYIVYDFMREAMGLSGVTLQVYALIYSFTKAGGDCHASLNNMAKRVDASSKSIQRSLKELLDKGYIIKTTNHTATSNHYIADMDKVGQNVHGQSEEGGQNVHGGETKCPGGIDTMSNNNKDNNKEDNTNINIHSLIKEYYKDKPRPIQPFGSKKLVMMTLHQYANLLRAVGVQPTLMYVRLLENRIIKGMFPVGDDHYQQIIDWAREDGRITPEGEIILKN